MENNDGHLKKLAAGLFFITGLSLIAVSVFIIGLDRGLTEPKFQVIALFNQVGNLAERLFVVSGIGKSQVIPA